jgi:hypothetical protein
MKFYSKAIQQGLLAAALLSTPVLAQTGASGPETGTSGSMPNSTPGTTPNSTPGTASQPGTNSPYGTTNDNSGNHNFGWIGLVGLLGLVGLKRRNNGPVVDDRTNVRR